MLKAANQNVKYCYHRALQAEERATQTLILWTGNFGLIVQRDGSRWLRLTSIKRGFQIS